MESPLGVALKTVRTRKTNKTIRVCDDCGCPLIWTFFFAYKERYCLNCGVAGGMMGTGEDVPATRELIFKKKLVDAIWKVLYSNKGLIPRSEFSRIGCKKCGNDHREHLSNSEVEWNEIATKYLEKFKGVFNV